MNKCIRCDDKPVIIEKGKVLCARCYMLKEAALVKESRRQMTHEEFSVLSDMGMI